jgi:zinc protease
VSLEELAAARAALTRGYVRNFETVGQIARAATQLVVHALSDDTFDRFVPAVELIGQDDVHAAARADVRPDESTVVVVGDAATCAPLLESLGRTVVVTVPEF